MREAKVRVRQGNLHGGEFEGLVQRPVIRDTGACLFREQTRQKPDGTHTDRAGRCLPCRARRIPSGQAALPKDAQLGDALQHNPPPAPYMCMLYVLYVLYGPQPALPRVPCYMCYMCYISQGNPLNIHSPRVPCYMYYMCYMGLTRQPTEHPLSPGSLLYVLYVLYGSYKATH